MPLPECFHFFSQNLAGDPGIARINHEGEARISMLPNRFRAVGRGRHPSIASLHR
jgi:hypothetical protein